VKTKPFFIARGTLAGHLPATHHHKTHPLASAKPGTVYPPRLAKKAAEVRSFSGDCPLSVPYQRNSVIKSGKQQLSMKRASDNLSDDCVLLGSVVIFA
jgi:hypothetical protein